MSALYKWQQLSGSYWRLYRQLRAGKGSVDLTDDRAWYATVQDWNDGQGFLVDYWKLDGEEDQFSGDWTEIGYYPNVTEAKTAALNALLLNLGGWP